MPSSPSGGSGPRSSRTQPAEPLDGCFVTRTPGGDLRVLGVFGLRPERAGFSAVEAIGAAARRPGARGRRRRSSRPPFRGRGRRAPLHRGRGRAARARLAHPGLAASWQPERPDGDPEGLHGQEGRGARCWSRSPPSSSSRARTPSASAPSAPPPSHRRLPAAICGRAGRRHARGDQGRRARHAPDRRRSSRHRPGSHARGAARADPTRAGRDAAISGLGVAKIRQIHDVLGIDSLPELEEAARDGRLAKLPRFGRKTAENILKGIAFLRQASAFRLSHHAAEEAEVCARRWRGSRASPPRSSRATCAAARRSCATWSSCSWPRCRRPSCSGG